MTRRMRGFLLPLIVAMPLAGCSTVGPDLNIDPAEWFAGDFFNSKKPLPGDRKAVFPEGVPGVARGVPPELMRGPPPGVEPAGGFAGDVVREEPKSKAKARPKPKLAVRPAPAAPVRAAAPRREPVSPDAPPPRAAAKGGGGADWPDPPAGAAPARPGPAWPEPPASRPSTTGGGVAWPEPPTR